MDDFPGRFTRSVSGPRRCLSCQKMVYFTGVRCRLCGVVTHKSCSSHPCNPRRKSYQPSLDSIDSSWDGSIEQMVRECAPSDDDVFTSKKSGAMSSLIKVANWLVQRRKSKESFSEGRRLSFFKISSKPCLSPQGSTSSSDCISTSTYLTSAEEPRRRMRPQLSKARTLSIEPNPSSSDPLSATWPQIGQSLASLKDLVEDTESGIIDCDNNTQRCSNEDAARDTLDEWSIPYSDLEFGETIRQSWKGALHRGKWHGEVMIYTYNSSHENDMNDFMDEVAQMSMIRHENIVLFMGACIEPPRLAIITSMRKGPSLYEYIHLKKNKLPFHNKVNIAKQIAQGMGYLHAKGIIHRKINSKNIIIENRVKLCIMDQSSMYHHYNKEDYGSMPRGYLSYLSPELIRSLYIKHSLVQVSSHPTQHSDIYAYGSVLYELFIEKFGFSNFHPHVIIWQVGRGQHPSLNNFHASCPKLKNLIKKCWTADPNARPPFSEILLQLQENVTLQKRHSCSEPERLNTLGLRN